MKSRIFSSIALTLVLAAFLTGCGKDSSEDVAPGAYMRDPEFRAQLKECRETRSQQLEKRLQLADELAAEQAKDADSERVKELQSQLQASEEQAVKDRRETYRLVREQLLNKDGGNK